MSKPSPNEVDIPIDIPYQKVLEWLFDRKKLSEKWRLDVNKILEKFRAFCDAEEQKDENFLKSDSTLSSYLSVPFNYYICCQAIEYLEKLVAKSPQQKNYAKFLSQIKELSKMYEKDNVFLGELGQILIRNTNYEIPALRKTIDSKEKQIIELHRKEAEYSRQVTTYLTKFKEECEELKIQGDDIKQELENLTSELPQHFDQISKKTQFEIIAKALAYYKAFIRFTLMSLQEEQTVCPTLSFVHSHGNLSVKELKMISSPESIPADYDDVIAKIISAEKSKETASSAAAPTINWDFSLADTNDEEKGGGEGFGDMNNNVYEINFDTSDIVILESGEGAGGIQAADNENKQGNQNEKEKEKEGGEGAKEINWDISSFEIIPDEEGSKVAGTPAPSINWDIGVIEEGETGGEKGVEKEEGLSSTFKTKKRDKQDEYLLLRQSVLENIHTRNSFVDDLLELQAFLSQRLVELESKENNTFNQNQISAAEIGMYDDSQTVTSMFEFISSLIDTLCGGRVRLLLEIKNSKAYIDRLAASIKDKKNMATKLSNSIAEFGIKKVELAEGISQTETKLADLIFFTKSAKKKVEQSISTVLKGRVVNIVGDINNI